MNLVFDYTKINYINAYIALFFFTILDDGKNWYEVCEFGCFRVYFNG